MPNTPIHVDSRAWTGDLDFSPREAEVLGRPVAADQRRKLKGACAIVTLIAGVLLCVVVDMTVWWLDGARAYVATADVSWFFLIAAAISVVSCLLAIRSDRTRLWLSTTIVASLTAELSVSLPYLNDAAKREPLHMVTFAIDAVDLRNSSRGGGWDKIRPVAHLIDKTGRRWTLEGRQHFIAPLRRHDCVTLSLRGAPRGYRFPDGWRLFGETPYLDSITGRRHLSRCFGPRP